MGTELQQEGKQLPEFTWNDKTGNIKFNVKEQKVTKENVSQTQGEGKDEASSDEDVPQYKSALPTMNSVQTTSFQNDTSNVGIGIENEMNKSMDMRMLFGDMGSDVDMLESVVADQTNNENDNQECDDPEIIFDDCANEQIQRSNNDNII